jgi:hypothetical protein
MLVETKNMISIEFTSEVLHVNSNIMLELSSMHIYEYIYIYMYS